ncbi:MAG: TonB-dependent receptor [Gammaproteobacteria bacterium]|nr:TonB-dependent receptor [Gammaproteobacteria bacterium]
MTNEGNTMNQLWKKWLCLLPAALLCVGFAYAETAEDLSEEAAMDYLMEMDFSALDEVEVSLDEVFDIFDGLVKTRRTKLSTGAKQSTAQAPSSATVITAQDIEATGASRLAEMLESVPGLHVAVSSLVYMPVYVFRGMFTNNNNLALVMINGMPVNLTSIRNQGPGQGGMPVNAISRIEIIRGPGSAVYGADAFSGVINIITKNKGDIDGTETGIRAGSFDTYDAWVLHGGAYGGFDVAAMLEFYITDGHGEIVEADGQTPLDKEFGTSASFAPGPVTLTQRDLDARLDVSKGNWRLRAGHQRRRNTGLGAGLNSLDPIGLLAAVDRGNVDLTWHDPYLTENWDVDAKLSFYDYKLKPDSLPMHLFPPGAFGGGLPDGMIFNLWLYERNARLDLSGFYAGFKKHLIRVGTGYHYGDIPKWKGTQNSSPDSTEITEVPGLASLTKINHSWYVNLQDIWTISPDWELTAGIRYDKFKDIAETVNPRAALVWQARPGLTAKLLYGRAFRVPSILELYDPSPIGGQIGNPSLEPEIIDWEELTFSWMAAENLHLALNLFAYQGSDVIREVPIPGKTYNIFSNTGEQEGHGLEFEARWKMTAKSSLLFNYAWQNSENKDGHNPGYAPRNQAYVRADWMFAPDWFLDAQTKRVAGRKRIFSDARPEIDDYITVDITTRYKSRQSPWNMAAGIRNLFDEDARAPSPGSATPSDYPFDYPLAGRSFWAEVRYKF